LLILIITHCLILAKIPIKDLWVCKLWIHWLDP
jgi:hypothetical protein